MTKMYNMDKTNTDSLIDDLDDLGLVPRITVMNLTPNRSVICRWMNKDKTETYQHDGIDHTVSFRCDIGDKISLSVTQTTRDGKRIEMTTDWIFDLVVKESVTVDYADHYMFSEKVKEEIIWASGIPKSYFNAQPTQ